MVDFLKKHWTTIILYLILLTGLFLLMYPGVSERWNSSRHSKMIDHYIEEVENMSGETAQAMLEEAGRYNSWLSTQDLEFLLTEDEENEYKAILDVTGMIGYLNIPKINVDLPICLGDDEEVLKTAVGHIPGSSFPVGGESTHSVLLGHRGLPSARLLTDLDQLKEGDIFKITVLDQTITYEVDQIRIVEPEDLSELQIIPGEDYCTLVTCTPYGVNTHRLLVRGRRTEKAADVVIRDNDAVKVPLYIVIPAVGIPIIFVMLLVLLIDSYCRDIPKTRKTKVKELRKSHRKVRRKRP